jgi:hypothetical protein
MNTLDRTRGAVLLDGTTAALKRIGIAALYVVLLVKAWRWSRLPGQWRPW